MLLLATLAALGAARLVELVVSRRNERALASRGGVRAARDGFGWILLVHVVFFPALATEWFLAAWTTAGVHTWILLGVGLSAMLLRYWAAHSLGDRYTVRVWRVAGEALVARGPYRWMKHPIYVAVAVEVIAFPLAFAAYVTAATLGLVNVAALWNRVRLEESHLARNP